MVRNEVSNPGFWDRLYSTNNDAGFYNQPTPRFPGSYLTYPFYGAKDDVTYVVEISKDLTSWTSTGVEVTNPGSDGYRAARFQLVDGRCFVRFRFLLN